MNGRGTNEKIPFNEVEFACFDFETTGFSSKRDRVIEVAVGNRLSRESWQRMDNTGESWKRRKTGSNSRPWH